MIKCILEETFFLHCPAILILDQRMSKRISALKRLGQPVPLSTATRSLSREASVNDARELLSQRNQATFDARQLLSRQSSNAEMQEDPGKMVVITGLKDMKLKGGRVMSDDRSID